MGFRVLVLGFRGLGALSDVQTNTKAIISKTWNPLRVPFTLSFRGQHSESRVVGYSAECLYGDFRVILLPMISNPILQHGGFKTYAFRGI